MSKDLKTTITHPGQRYLDAPVVIKPKKQAMISVAVQEAFSHHQRAPILVAHERVRLRWMTSDGKGGLKPRGAT